MVPVASAPTALVLIEEGLAKRHTAGTAMNRESSRSHLIIGLVVEATNLQTQGQARGKLSFVDLAGSERWGRGGGRCRAGLGGGGWGAGWGARQGVQASFDSWPRTRTFRLHDPNPCLPPAAG
jgi:hypothetical protein